jgi:HD-GYP domain-containing protein (c-di-GMP phosphodiesterase class II)
MRTLESMGTIIAIALRNAEALTSASELYLDTVKALALAMETKDPFAHGCTERVYAVTMELGTQLGLEGEELRALGFAALLHDIGMAAAGDLDAIADRPLTTVERGILMMHPVIAANVVERAPMLRAAVPIIFHHHEHYDGGGYLHGLSGDRIPRGARILAVADAYVSMTSPRTYRPSMTVHEALAELETLAGTQFDPLVVVTLAQLVTASVLD